MYRLHTLLGRLCSALQERTGWSLNWSGACQGCTCRSMSVNLILLHHIAWRSSMLLRDPTTTACHTFACHICQNQVGLPCAADSLYVHASMYAGGK
jgi:hypothetical protein